MTGMRGWGIGRWLHPDPCYCLTGRAGMPGCLDLMSLKNYSSLKLQRIGPCSLTGMKTGPNDTLHGRDLSRRLHKHEEMGRRASSWSVSRPKSDRRFIPEWSRLAANVSVSGPHTCAHQHSFCKLSKQLTTPRRMLVTTPQIPHLWNSKQSIFVSIPYS